MALEAAAISETSLHEKRVNAPGGRARPWDILRHLSSAAKRSDAFIEARAFERGNWLVVGFGAGIVIWLALPGTIHWAGVLAACAGLVVSAMALKADGQYSWLRTALISVPVMVSAGLLTVWIKSEAVGAPGIRRPLVAVVTGQIEGRRDIGAEQRIRLTLLARLPGIERPVRVRIAISAVDDAPGMQQGAIVQVRARLMPPAPPLLPGSSDFARTAWFAGVVATGSAMGKPEIVVPVKEAGLLAGWRRGLSSHIREQLAGTPGAIAIALATGDRGDIARSDELAMRDSGLSHLLSISGLHVSAVVGAAYVFAIRVLALWQWLALRTRLPLIAASAGALTGIGYTLLTGAEVPTIRSCIGAVLVLLALALGRDPLSMRMIAVAAFFVLLFWPEALFGPSFQMSFAAVIAIVALHGSAPVRALAKKPNEPLPFRVARHVALLLLTGVVIELALMPIGLFHFHRTGVYGALANVIAIPLTTFVTMPLIAIGLLMDLAGIGAPFWWGVGLSLELLLWLAHTTAAQPGSVAMFPPMGSATFALFATGLLWIGLWTGRVRWLGLVPVGAGILGLATLQAADVLVSGDGRNVGVIGNNGEMLVLRDGRGDYVQSHFREISGSEGEVRTFESWPGARCNRDFCRLSLDGGSSHRTEVVLLVARGNDRVDWRPLVEACGRADIVIAPRRLPRSCQPQLLKIDRPVLSRTGGIAIHFQNNEIRTVSQGQGQHGWYRWPIKDQPPRKSGPKSMPDTASRGYE